MACPEFGSVKAVAERLGVSVSFLNRLRVYSPDKSPPFIPLLSGPGKRGRIVYPLTGPDSLETWAAERVQCRAAKS
jgi:hypothetical protein